MSFWNALKGEFIDIVEWLDDSSDTLVWRFPRHDNEIKNGARLVVREGQSALMVNEGELADRFEPGTYTLETRNLPILSTLRGWKHGFDSPFKVEVYFVSTRQFTDQKWGTPNPVLLRDAEFGMVRLRAFGTFSYRVADPALLLREIVGTDGHFTVDEIHNQLRALAVTEFSDAVAEARIPVLDLASRYKELGDAIGASITPDFARYGIELTRFLIGNISLPPEVERAIDQRSSMGAVGNLDAYLRFQTAQAVEKGAANPASGSGAVELGVGLAMAEQIRGAAAPDRGRVPPPLPQDAYHVVVRGQPQGPYQLPDLQGMAASGALTRDTLVWRPGMTHWTAAGQIAELAGLFGHLPPPLPQ